MSKTSDSGLFFQTDASLAEVARKAKKNKNKAGNPIQLQSKALAVIQDPFSDGAIYVAESSGFVRRVVLETGDVSPPFWRNLSGQAGDGASSATANTAPQAPMTCLTVSAQQNKIFAGNWDKNIYAWNLVRPHTAGVPASHPSDTYHSGNGTFSTYDSVDLYKGHSDFVKCLAVISGNSTSPTLLLSGSADKTVKIWNISYPFCAPIFTISAHTRPILALAVDPTSLGLSNGSADDSAGPVFIGGDSSRDITFRRLKNFSDIKSADGEKRLDFEATGPLRHHETSVQALAISSDGSELWSASADKTAQRIQLPLSPSKSNTTDGGNDQLSNIKPDTVFKHPSSVNAIAIVEERGLVVTGCQDEIVRVWNVASGKCIAELDGHWEAVSGVVVVEGGKAIVSVSHDGTVRKWGLTKDELETAMALGRGEVDEKGKENATLLTEEEERELAELMDDDD